MEKKAPKDRNPFRKSNVGKNSTSEEKNNISAKGVLQGKKVFSTKNICILR